MNSKENRGGRRPGAGRPKNKEPKRTIVFRLDASLYEALSNISIQTGRTRTDIVSECIKAFVREGKFLGKTKYSIKQ